MGAAQLSIQCGHFCAYYLIDNLPPKLDVNEGSSASHWSTITLLTKWRRSWPYCRKFWLNNKVKVNINSNTIKSLHSWLPLDNPKLKVARTNCSTYEGSLLEASEVNPLVGPHPLRMSKTPLLYFLPIEGFLTETTNYHVESDAIRSSGDNKTEPARLDG
ncbi:hypothetical protein EV702DRAFT_1111363 [Suillus placidus]|uniref:Uncharacterized protein n=1 Tax=Suillus placidus TaxID=48579 RepID=A0A9P7D0S7_9AGAM|nr:hypothetical protein EV702DRAFT_1111363 [Suillus placidus]